MPRALWRILNAAAYCALVGMNTNVLVESAGVYRSGKETYFTPAHHAFGIWSLIYFLLLGYPLYQYTDTGENLLVDGAVGRTFLVLVVLTVAYIKVWFGGHHTLAFILATLMFFTALIVWDVFVKGIAVQRAVQLSPTQNAWHLRVIAAAPLSAKLLVGLPFSMYCGWTATLVVLTAFEAFGVDALTHPAGMFTKAFVFTGLLFITMMGVVFTYGIGGAIAVTWALYAISQHQSDQFIHWSALMLAPIPLVFVGAYVFGEQKENDQSEPSQGSAHGHEAAQGPQVPAPPLNTAHRDLAM